MKHLARINLGRLHDDADGPRAAQFMDYAGGVRLVGNARPASRKAEKRNTVTRISINAEARR